MRVAGSRRRHLFVRGDRLVEQPAIAARGDQAGEQLRIRSPRPGSGEQPHHRVTGASGFRLEVRVQIVRRGQIGVEGERPFEGTLRTHELLVARRAAAAELGDDAQRATQPRPRRGVARVERDRALVQVAYLRPLRRVGGHLVAAQEQLVRLGAGRDVLPQRPLVVPCQRHVQGGDDGLGQCVLELEEIVNRRLDGVRPQQRPFRNRHQLRRQPQLVARPHERAGDDRVDLHLARQRLQVRPARRRRSSRQARPHDHGFQAR